MPKEEILQALFALRDEEYGQFQRRLIPTVAPESVIGVRTPQLRALARRLVREGRLDACLDGLPHRYFEENQLHAFAVSELRPYERCMEEVCRFLPYVDNWATCDQMSPRVFRRHRDRLLPQVREWLGSGETYTVRFAVRMLMDHYLDEDFDPACLALAAAVRSEEYYVRMMVAWYFATALAKRYGEALPYLEEGRLDPQTLRMTVRKAAESFRVPPERKEHLRTLVR